MKAYLGSFLMLLAAGLPAGAATVVNRDESPVVMVVVENGNRMEVAIDPGGSETVCPGGCFVTLPNGDRLGLDGGETVEIVKGSAVIK